MTDEISEVLTVREVARYLRLAKATVYKLARAGEIPAVRVGRAWRFPKQLLDEWLEQGMRQNLRRSDDDGR